jgi:hypothetical protein
MVRQVFFHYSDLEEHRHGLWRSTPVDEREGYIEASAELMRNPAAFRAAMERVLTEWPNSAMAAMTTPGLNQRAYMGHAGCCINHQSPEDLTRLGWHRLTELEQDLANAAADEVIAQWKPSAKLVSSGRLF